MKVFMVTYQAPHTKKSTNIIKLSVANILRLERLDCFMASCRPFSVKEAQLLKSVSVYSRISVAW